MAEGTGFPFPPHYLQQLVESSPDIVVAVDRSGTIVFYNDGAEKNIGYAASEMGARTARIKVLDWNEASLSVACSVGGREVAREPSDAGGTFVVFEVPLRVQG